MTAATVGEIIGKDETLEANGDYYIAERGAISLTLGETFDGALINIYPGEMGATDETVIVSGSAADIAAPYNKGLALGVVRINVADVGTTAITVNVQPLYSRKSNE